MLVSICMITYNHQQFIGEAIDSILSQETIFEIELIIGEDCSTDNTLKTCIDYVNRNPDRIKLVASASNVGLMKNFFRTYQACQGKYIAFCEGDDYWTDPHKLQKQVDFMEAHPQYSASFHNVTLKRERGVEMSSNVLHESLPKLSFNTEDILGPWFIASPSFLFVNYSDFNLPEWYFNCVYGDLPFMLLLSLRGDFGYIDEVMAVYRLHDTGLTTVHKSYDKIMVMLYIYCSFDIFTNYKFHQEIRKAVIYEIDRHTPQKKIENVAPQKVFFKRISGYINRIKAKI